MKKFLKKNDWTRKMKFFEGKSVLKKKISEKKVELTAPTENEVFEEKSVLRAKRIRILKRDSMR